MARKTIDVWPVLTVTPEQPGQCWTKDQALAAYREVNEALSRVHTPSRYRLNIGFNFQEDDRCEHCNATWTEVSDVYNGGCCAKDEANSPERLVAMFEAAQRVAGGDYYRIDDGRRDRQTASEPEALACALSIWIDHGRPEAEVARLLKLADAVDASEWCTVWSDPGVYPSNAGGAPLPDQVTIASEPNDLADDLRRLVDDMGLLTSREAA